MKQDHPKNSQGEAPEEQTPAQNHPKPAQPSWSDRPLVRLGLNILAAAVLLLLVYLVLRRTGVLPTSASTDNPSTLSVASGPSVPVTLEPLGGEPTAFPVGVRARADLKTIIPNRPRTNVITYTVRTGDNLFAIATDYNLKPETLLWSNYDTLRDNPQLLSIDQVLNIPPENGAYYKWKEGDTVDSVAAYYSVEPSAILDYPGNPIDLTTVTSGTVSIPADTWIFIPGGSRPLKDWGPPAISRANPAAARYYGDGYCGSVYTGAIGTGTFVWPTTEHFLSGYHYSAIHRAIDIGGSIGNAVYASDAGVVVYSGWSNSGYGNLIVVDHGNGWQTAYAHLSTIGVTCGQSVYQGGYIGGLGSTGNSTGPHLHFEMGLNGSKVDPLGYVK